MAEAGEAPELRREGSARRAVGHDEGGVVLWQRAPCGDSVIVTTGDDDEDDDDNDDGNDDDGGGSKAKKILAV